MQSLSIIPRFSSRLAHPLKEIREILDTWPRRYGWTLAYQGRTTVAPGVEVDSWKVIGVADLRLEYVSDQSSRLMWLSAISDEPDRCRNLFDRMRDSFEYYEIDELLLEGDWPIKTRLLALALAANQTYDQRVHAIIDRALMDSDVEVRAQAAIASSLLLWDVLRPLLIAAWWRETEKDVKEMLSAAVRLIDMTSASPD